MPSAERCGLKAIFYRGGRERSVLSLEARWKTSACEISRGGRWLMTVALPRAAQRVVMACSIRRRHDDEAEHVRRLRPGRNRRPAA